MSLLWVTAGWPLKKDEKSGPGFLVSATFVALNTADMYISAGVNASDKVDYQRPVAKQGETVSVPVLLWRALFF
jgi:hypothetical protein